MIDHVKECQLGKALNMSVGVACQHGYDICPTCDPCTCPAEIKEARSAAFILEKLEEDAKDPTDEAALQEYLRSHLSNSFAKMKNTPATREAIRTAVQGKLADLCHQGTIGSYNVEVLPADDPRGGAVTIKVKTNITPRHPTVEFKIIGADVHDLKNP